MKLDLCALIELIFPRSEDEQRISSCTPERFNTKMHITPLRYGIVGLCAFSDPEVRSALHLIKFHRNAHALRLVSSLVRTYVRTHVHEENIVIPIPLSTERRKQRGYNQTELIVRAVLEDQAPGLLRTDILVKVRNTPPQTSLKRHERLTNLQGAFAVPHQKTSDVRNRHIMLIDDVTTTGSTLRAARQALLLHHPASVTCIGIAH